MSYKVVIAIDFGTSRSGFAYAFFDDPDLICKKSDWNSRGYNKTSTCLLYDANDRLVAWGDNAKKKLAEERKSSKKNKDNNSKYFYLIENFKMQILSPDGKYREDFKIVQQSKGINSSYKIDGKIFITPKSKREIYISDLVVDYLSSIKDVALEKVQPSYKSKILDKEIRWVLTVPAIWEDKDKQFMREASIKAKLITQDEDDYNRLLLAFEPEAAAFFCNRQKALVDNNSVFMILDCGGGTVDISTYTLLNNKFQSIQGVINTGGPYGSTFVNHEITKALLKKIPSEAMVKFQVEHPIEYYEMNWAIEELKCDITLDNQNQYMSFRVPRDLDDILEEEFRNQHSELLEEDGGEKHVENITIPCSKKSLFEATLNGLVNKANEAFNLLSKTGIKCDYILLVGGYSNSLFLQQRIHDEYEVSGKVKKVIHPIDSDSAVMFGAVYFGLNPDIWVNRVSSRTYGTDVTRKFSYGDPESKKIIIDGIEYCNDLFLTFVKKGDIVPTGNKKEHKFHPLSKDQTEIDFKLCSSSSDDPKFVDEPNVFHHESAKITRENTISGKNWTILVSMYFGETEIKVEFTNSDTGLTKVLRINFRSQYK